MVRLTRIYTRTGDDGHTGLGDGSRVSKHDVRVAAYGTVDEANSIIGLARVHAEGAPDEMLQRIQNDLFDLGADFCVPGDGTDDGARAHPPLRMIAAQVERLEAEIDAMNARLEPLKSFILPGGTPLAAHLHHARTVVRRAERAAALLAGAAATVPRISTAGRLP